MLLRPATMNDAALLFAWRNDPQTRMNSRSTAEISYEEHLAWLEKTLNDPRRELMIAVEGVPVGTVRCDLNDDGLELSWTVSPQHRGKGLGAKMIAEIVKNQQTDILADINDLNLPSIAIARKNGFVPLSKEGEFTRWIRRLSTQKS